MSTVAVFIHDAEERAGNLRKFLSEKGLNVKEFHLYKGEMPQDIHSYNAFILMGGPMSVKDEKQYPFLKKEKMFVENWLKSDKPLLGICLGAQLIAEITNARVYKAPVAEIGWHELFLTPQGEKDPLFRLFPQRWWFFNGMKRPSIYRSRQFCLHPLLCTLKRIELDKEYTEYNFTSRL